MYNLGLVGKNLQHSGSKIYFENKFKKEGLKNFTYNLYELRKIEEFNTLLKTKNVTGLNVTYPYKESIINHIDQLDIISKKTRSVNTLFINKKNNIKGYNTDVFGFEKSLESFLNSSKIKALVLGNGGVSKSICYVLEKKNIEYLVVSRKPNNDNIISYKNSEKYLETHKLIINTTILGGTEYIKKFPQINYDMLSKKHYMYDVIYNPIETIFLKKGKKKGANILNGQKMLILQAELSFEIWKKQIQGIKHV